MRQIWPNKTISLNPLLYYLVLVSKLLFFKSITAAWLKCESYALSLHQDVPHSLDVLVSIIRLKCCFISARKISHSTKPDYRIASEAVILLVTNDADSCSEETAAVTYSIEPFPVAVLLQRGLRTNHLLPRVTTQ